MPKIDFSFDTRYGTFSDALWFPDEQPMPSDDDFEALKQQRLTNWLAVIEAPLVEEPPPSEVP